MTGISNSHLADSCTSSAFHEATPEYGHPDIQHYLEVQPTSGSLSMTHSIICRSDVRSAPLCLETTAVTVPQRLSSKLVLEI